MNGYQLITSSTWKNAQNASTGGIGLLLLDRASENLLSVVKISPRIVVVQLEGNPKTTIIACCSPTNCRIESK